MERSIELLLAFVLGPITGALFAWLLLHTRARSWDQKNLSAIQTKLVTLREQLLGKEKQVQELISSLENSESEMNSLRAELKANSSGTTIAEETTSRISELEVELEAKEQTLIPLQQAHAALQKRSSEFESNLKKKTQRAQVLESQLEAAQSEVDRLKEKCNSESSQQADIEKSKARISQLESMLKAKDAAFKESQERFFESQANLKNANRLIEKSLRSAPKLQKQSAESHEELKQAVEEKLTKFEEKLSQPEFSNVVQVINAAKLSQNFNELKDKELQGVFGGFKRKFRTFLGGWFNDIKKQYAEQAEQRRDRLKAFKSYGPYSLLLVDDNLRSREQLKFILESEGYIVHKVGHGEQTLASASEHKPDLIFIDMTFDMSGFESMKQLKQSAKLKEVPTIVIIRSENVEQIVRRSMELGISDFIVRPIRRLELREKIFQCISQKQFEQNKMKSVLHKIR